MGGGHPGRQKPHLPHLHFPISAIFLDSGWPPTLCYRLDSPARPGLCRSVPVVGGRESILPFRCLAKFDHLLDVFAVCL